MKTGLALIADIDEYRSCPDELAFWWLGQHSFVIKAGAAVCYLDPFLSPLAGRTVAPLLDAAEVTNAMLVCGSHDHADHIDRPAWPVIAAASPKTCFIVPKLLRETLAQEIGMPPGRILGVDEGITVEIAGMKVTGVPAAHEFLDTDPGTGLHPYLGFVIETNGFTIYHAGDTCMYEGMQALLRRWTFDLAFLPINGRDARRLAANCIGNLTYQEAADLAGALQPGLTVPTHFDMFAMNRENPQLFSDYMRVKYPGLATGIPVHGERTIVRKRRSLSAIPVKPN